MSTFMTRTGPSARTTARFLDGRDAMVAFGGGMRERDEEVDDSRFDTGDAERPVDGAGRGTP